MLNNALPVYAPKQHTQCSAVLALQALIKQIHLVRRGSSNKSGREQGTKSSSLASFGERVEVCVQGSVGKCDGGSVVVVRERGGGNPVVG